MHELKRLAYLDAMGVDAFISRAQLPGAAPTRRLVLPVQVATSTVVEAAPVAPAGLPDFDVPERPVKAPAPAARVRASAAGPEHFTLATVLAGQWLWLEDIGGNPLGKEQVWLIQCMARALAVAGSSATPGEGLPQGAAPDVALFQWPIHTNDQFDLGPESAQVSASSFVARRLEQSRCLGLVCLGGGSESRLAAEQFNVPVVATRSTVEILADPSLKPIVWQQLAALATGR